MGDLKVPVAWPRRVGAALLACVVGLLGSVFTYRGVHDLALLHSGNQEAIDACVMSPALDCDPRGWAAGVSVGFVLLVVAIGLLACAVGGWRAEARSE